MMIDENTFIRRISFGCSNLLGDKTVEGGMALLEAAYDTGIRGFDVARVYNFGDAERLVGKFAGSRRSELTITTKFGLMPNANVARMGALVGIVRRMMRSSHFIRKLVRRNVSKITQGGRFDVPMAQASLEESLRMLNTDYIDIYLLHEAAASDYSDELLAFLEQARDQGKIRAFGVGSGYRQLAQVAQLAPRLLEVAQFDSSVTNDNRRAFEDIRPPGNKLVITHGSFSGTEFIQNAISTNAPQVQQWSERLGFDLKTPGLLHAALLHCALRSNTKGKVIFRASTPNRIRENMHALDTRFSCEQLNALEALCLETDTRSN